MNLNHFLGKGEIEDSVARVNKNELCVQVAWSCVCFFFQLNIEGASLNSAEMIIIVISLKQSWSIKLGFWRQHRLC